MPVHSITHRSGVPVSDESRRRLVRGVLVALPASLLAWAAVLAALAALAW